MSNKGKSLSETLSSAFATGAILVSILLGIVIYKLIMGNPMNFEGNNPSIEIATTYGSGALTDCVLLHCRCWTKLAPNGQGMIKVAL